MKEILAPWSLPRPAGWWKRILSRAGLQKDYHQLVLRAHEPIRTAETCMPADRFERYFKFTFVRNPWDRLVSEYEFLRQTPAHGRHRKVVAMADFQEFVAFQARRKDAYQLNLLTDANGKICLDFIGRFEQLQQDFAEVCRRIGLDAKPLRHLKNSHRGDYHDYFTPELARSVAKTWGEEIEAFGYRFEAS